MFCENVCRVVSCGNLGGCPFSMLDNVLHLPVPLHKVQLLRRKAQLPSRCRQFASESAPGFEH
eukprot:3143241-Amphidinium_carterae.1